MSGFSSTSLPEKVMFDCNPDGLSVIDQAQMGELLKGGSVTPLMRFEVGERNILESAPIRATRTGTLVTVECTAAKVELDLHEETAKKRTAGGELMIYMGGLDEANHGLGWIPAG